MNTLKLYSDESNVLSNISIKIGMGYVSCTAWLAKWVAFLGLLRNDGKH